MSLRLRGLARWRSRRERRAALLVMGGLLGFVVSVYVVIVLGGGVLIGHTDSPQVGLSVLATAVVALGFGRVQERLERLATRVVHDGRPSPYDVLSRFAGNVTGSYANEELPPRMAMVLAEGTGAEWAQVWLHVQGRLTLAATWPPDTSAVLTPPPELSLRAKAVADGPAGDAAAGGDRLRWLPVRHRGELLGVLRLREREREPLTPVEERLFFGLAAQAGLVLRGARLRAELAARLVELVARAQELRESRERLVDTQDDERRRLERDIHDGAQQHLVALAVNLRLAQTLAERAPERAGAVLAAQVEAAQETIETLTDLSRGIYPRLLGEEGLVPALRAAASNSPVPVQVYAEGLARYPAGIEAAAYFCCLEALQNAAKHSGASRVALRLRDRDGVIELEVADDGKGFDPLVVGTGVGMASMRDRLDSVGGSLTVTAAAGAGVAVRGRIPTPRRG
jgi:signal transduction histidine kinase